MQLLQKDMWGAIPALTTRPFTVRSTGTVIWRNTRSVGTLLIGYALVLVLTAPALSAQDDVGDAARRAFQEGTEAAETERWADSELAFRRAYGLSHAPSALFNQAVALRALGRHLEARDAFDALLARTDAEVSADLRESAAALRAESAARVATLELVGLDLTAHRIRIDGRQIPDSLARPLRVELAEGTHTLEVQRDGYAPFVDSESLAPGERRSIRVALTTRRDKEDNTRRDTDDNTARKRRRWLWIGSSVLVVATGLTTTTALLVRSRDETISPRSDRVFEVP